MEKLQIVVKASDILATKLVEPDPETLERVRRLAAKVPALGCMYSSPVVQRLAVAAARAEEEALRDRTVREMLARHGLTEKASRAEIMVAIGTEYEAAVERLEAMFRIMTT